MKGRGNHESPSAFPCDTPPLHGSKVGGTCFCVETKRGNTLLSSIISILSRFSSRCGTQELSLNKRRFSAPVPSV